MCTPPLGTCGDTVSFDSTYSEDVVNVLLMAIDYLLTHNDLIFGGKSYLQLSGSSMGAKFSHLLPIFLLHGGKKMTSPLHSILRLSAWNVMAAT